MLVDMPVGQFNLFEVRWLVNIRGRCGEKGGIGIIGGILSFAGRGAPILKRNESKRGSVAVVAFR